MSGKFALNRNWREHAMFRNEPFNRACAWVWMIERACFKPTPFDVNGKIITLQRGQLCVSMRHLADAWGWSKSSVERFITRLKTETMIGTEVGTGKLIITICNYDKHQPSNEYSGTVNGTQSGTPAGHQRDTKEKGNKEIRDKEDKSSFVISENDEPENQPPAKPKISQSEIDEAIECYKLGASQAGWPELRKIDANRRSKLASRLKENGLEGWKEALRRALRSQQLGRDPPGWFNFRWLTNNSENILKVLEGNYDKRFGNNGNAGSEPKLSPTLRAAQALEERFAAQAGGQDGLFRSAGADGPRLALPSR